MSQIVDLNGNPLSSDEPPEKPTAPPAAPDTEAITDITNMLLQGVCDLEQYPIEQIGEYYRAQREPLTMAERAATPEEESIAAIMIWSGGYYHGIRPHIARLRQIAAQRKAGG